jgi:hypothetical protein
MVKVVPRSPLEGETFTFKASLFLNNPIIQFQKFMNVFILA